MLRIGTRASLLARTQSGHVADALAVAGEETRLVEVTTHGDTSSAPLVSMGGVGVFVNALREALLRDDIDVAVHSLKDLPTGAAEGIALAAVPPRQDPRDAIIARDGLTLGELPPGSRVGTGSPRRVAQLAALGLGLEMVPVRGNVDTRLDKVRRGELDAVVLARAGLNRLGRAGQITETLDPLQVLPAAGQGALAIECRAADADLVRLLSSTLEDPGTRAAVRAERGVLAALEAGCAAPVGTLAEIAEGDDGEELWVRAVAMSLDGALAVRRSGTGPVGEAAELGVRLAEQMIQEGAGELVASVIEDRHPPTGTIPTGTPQTTPPERPENE